MVIFTVAALSLIVVLQPALAYTNYISDKTLSPISEASTRFHVPLKLTQLPFDTALLVNSTLLKFGAGCPPETAIYIHGWNRNQTEAREEFNRIQNSLDHNGYRIPLIGFSWNSNTDYPVAENIAIANGPRLAEFIIDFKKTCPDSHIHLIAHSLGASVVESTLVKLDTNSTLNANAIASNNNNNNSKIIKSVHLIGAAIDNKLIVKNSSFGNAIENLVDKFYNLYSPEDDGLEYNKAFKKYEPLGLVGAPKLDVIAATARNAPSNYNDTNVAYEIPPLSDADGDGNIEECFENIKPVRVWGDNHCGYIGFRQPIVGSLIDDGAMNIVVRDWIKP